jgi:hypothetical protein
MSIEQIIQSFGQWIGPALQKLAEFAVSLIVTLVTPKLLFVVAGIGIIIQGVKVLLQLRWRDVPTPLIVWVIGPTVGVIIAWGVWPSNGSDQIPWWLVGIVCSGIANLGYWIIVQKLLYRVAPQAANAINLTSTQGKLSPDK